MSSSTAYTASFFREIDAGSLESARVIVPRLCSLFQPQSVIDIGCGLGNFLLVFRELGIDDYLGIDGDYIERSELKIPITRFISHNLQKPVEIAREFDLALSLEVAEHLPEEVAKTFVESLTRLAPIIAFSAAIPFQPGNHHVNGRIIGRISFVVTATRCWIPFETNYCLINA
jgi:2-polyprenyl-3-methyl-5-hydroxy-6-metoxy-1,4-benzoquinol methylase